jgi:GGDEF domain-containing protein
METILDELVGFTGHQTGLLLLYDESTKQLQPVVGRDASRRTLLAAEWRFARAVVDRAITGGSPVPQPAPPVHSAAGGKEGKPMNALCLPLGIAVSPDHGETAEQLLRSADRALYEAKAAGRSQVQVYRPELEGGAPT